VNLRGSFGRTPLHCCMGDAEIAMFLLGNCNGEIDAVDEFLNTPLCLDGTSVVVMKCLLECGADIDHVRWDGMGKLHRTAMMSNGEGTKMCLQYGASVSLVDLKGRTARKRAFGDNMALFRRYAGEEVKKTGISN